MSVFSIAKNSSLAPAHFADQLPFSQGAN